MFLALPVSATITNRARRIGRLMTAPERAGLPSEAFPLDNRKLNFQSGKIHTCFQHCAIPQIGDSRNRINLYKTYNYSTSSDLFSEKNTCQFFKKYDFGRNA